MVPFHSTELRSRLSVSEVNARLAFATSPKAFWGFGSDGTTFRGRVEPSSFELVRRIRYRNSFIPVIRGNVEASGKGSIIRLRMRMHAFVIAFMFIWMLGASAGALVGVVAAWRAGDPGSLVVLLFPTFGACPAGFGFRAEANTAIETLCSMLEATETDEGS